MFTKFVWNHRFFVCQSHRPQQQQQQHDYNQLLQQQRSESVSSMDSNLPYPNKIFIEDFEQTDLVLNGRLLSELEHILYNSQETGKSKSHKMCPPGQVQARVDGAARSLPQLPAYQQQRSFKHRVAAAEGIERLEGCGREDEGSVDSHRRGGKWGRI